MATVSTKPVFTSARIEQPLAQQRTGLADPKPQPIRAPGATSETEENRRHRNDSETSTKSTRTDETVSDNDAPMEPEVDETEREAAECAAKEKELQDKLAAEKTQRAVALAGVIFGLVNLSFLQHVRKVQGLATSWASMSYLEMYSCAAPLLLFGMYSMLTKFLGIDLIAGSYKPDTQILTTSAIAETSVQSRYSDSSIRSGTDRNFDKGPHGPDKRQKNTPAVNAGLGMFNPSNMATSDMSWLLSPMSTSSASTASTAASSRQTRSSSASSSTTLRTKNVNIIRTSSMDSSSSSDSSISHIINKRDGEAAKLSKLGSGESASAFSTVARNGSSLPGAPKSPASPQPVSPPIARPPVLGSSSLLSPTPAKSGTAVPRNAPSSGTDEMDADAAAGAGTGAHARVSSSDTVVSTSNAQMSDNLSAGGPKVGGEASSALSSLGERSSPPTRLTVLTSHKSSSSSSVDPRSGLSLNLSPASQIPGALHSMSSNSAMAKGPSRSPSLSSFNDLEECGPNGSRRWRQTRQPSAHSHMSGLSAGFAGVSSRLTRHLSCGSSLEFMGKEVETPLQLALADLIQVREFVAHLDRKVIIQTLVDLRNEEDGLFEHQSETSSMYSSPTNLSRRGSMQGSSLLSQQQSSSKRLGTPGSSAPSGAQDSNSPLSSKNKSSSNTNNNNSNNNNNNSCSKNPAVQRVINESRKIPGVPKKMLSKNEQGSLSGKLSSTTEHKEPNGEPNSLSDVGDEDYMDPGSASECEEQHQEDPADTDDAMTSSSRCSKGLQRIDSIQTDGENENDDLPPPPMTSSSNASHDSASITDDHFDVLGDHGKNDVSSEDFPFHPLDALDDIIHVLSEPETLMQPILRGGDVDREGPVNGWLRLAGGPANFDDSERNLDFDHVGEFFTAYNNNKQRGRSLSEDGLAHAVNHKYHSAPSVPVVDGYNPENSRIREPQSAQTESKIDHDYSPTTPTEVLSSRRTSSSFGSLSGSPSSMHLQVLLGQLSDWNFDSLQLAQDTDGKPLYTMLWVIFSKCDFINSFRIDRRTFKAFAKQVDSQYQPMPYHNSAHAADVLVSMHHLLFEMHLGRELTKVEAFAAIFAAAVHDINHPGRNNNFLIRSDHQLSIIYSDTSVLEQMHLANAFQLIHTPGYNIAENLSKEDFAHFRKLTIKMVLATDLRNHFETITKLKGLAGTLSGDFVSVERRDLILEVCIKISDIGHASKRFPLHKRWSELITEEFFQQGDEEQELGLTVSDFMDRSRPENERNQVGFLDFVALPLYQVFREVFPLASDLFRQARRNRNEWKSLQRLATPPPTCTGSPPVPEAASPEEESDSEENPATQSPGTGQSGPVPIKAAA